MSQFDEFAARDRGLIILPAIPLPIWLSPRPSRSKGVYGGLGNRQLTTGGILKHVKTILVVSFP